MTYLCVGSYCMGVVGLFHIGGGGGGFSTPVAPLVPIRGSIMACISVCGGGGVSFRGGGSF